MKKPFSHSGATCCSTSVMTRILASTAAAITMSASQTQAMTMHFVLDNNPTNRANPEPPFVGDGALSFEDDLPDGTHLYTDLTNPLLWVTLGANTYSSLHSISFQNPLNIVIYNNGRSFYFDGCCSQPYKAALQVGNSDLSSILVFESHSWSRPPYTRYWVQTGPHYSGVYGTPAVPAPLPILGLAATLGFSRRLRERLRTAGLKR